jgi:hypothetical protein
VAKKELSFSNVNVPTNVLADFLGISVRRIDQLVKASVITKQASGAFHFRSAVDEYYVYKLVPKKKVDFDHEHALHEKAKRQMAENELALSEGKLHDADECEKIYASMLVTFRTRILAMGAKCAPKIIGQKNMAIIADIINAEGYEALESLSRIPAEKLGEAYEGESGQP